MFMQCVNNSLRIWTGIKSIIQFFWRKNKQFMKENCHKKGAFKAFLSEKLEWYDAICQDIERNGYRRSDSI